MIAALAALLLLAQAGPAAPLRAELVAADSATAVLQRRCAEPIRAEVHRGAAVPASAETRARLKLSAGEAVGYRRVTLKCGATALSEAENWYVPARLTPAMNAALAGDTPFGAAIRPLAPRRMLVDAAGQGETGVAPAVLRIRAIVTDGAGTPLAEVVERYTPVLATLPILR